MVNRSSLREHQNLCSPEMIQSLPHHHPRQLTTDQSFDPPQPDNLKGGEKKGVKGGGGDLNSARPSSTKELRLCEACNENAGEEGLSK